MMNINEFEKKQVLFVFLAAKEKISFQNDNIVVRKEDGKIKYQITCYRIFALFIVGHFTITSGLIQRSHRFGFPIFLMTNSMKIYDVLGGKMEGNVLLRQCQYSYKGLELAKHILQNKVSNQRIALNRQRDKSEELKAAIKQMDGYVNHIQQYEGNLEGLLGIEGSAARLYFRHQFNNLEWKARGPRIKADYVNSTLDIGYTILFNVIEGLLSIYGFDIYLGVLHKQFYMRKSLVCDIMEPFRPIIDLQIRKAVNLQQCQESDFEVINHQYLLKWKKNPAYVQFLMEAILENKMDMFRYVQQYYRSFMKQREASEFPVFEVKKL